MIKFTLDEDECINLLTVLRINNQPVDQEEVWAICYELGQLMRNLTPGKCAPIRSLAQIHLHKDGYIHEKSCSVNMTKKTTITSSNASAATATATKAKTTSTTTTPSATNRTDHTTSSTLSISNLIEPRNTNTTSQPQHHQTPPTPPTPPITPELNESLQRRPALNEFELVESLGIALYCVLDFGIPNGDERGLSHAMEYLINRAESLELSLDELLEICINRLPKNSKLEADTHYRDVCKSLVSFTIQTSMLIEKIYTASMVLSDITLDNCLEVTDHHHHHHNCDISDDDLSELGEPLAAKLRALRINDWARLWMQVIRELRQLSKFKQALTVN